MWAQKQQISNQTRSTSLHSNKSMHINLSNNTTSTSKTKNHIQKKEKLEIEPGSVELDESAAIFADLLLEVGFGEHNDVVRGDCGEDQEQS